MKRWCMVIDIEKCENCNNCFLACKDEHYNNDWPDYTASQPLHGHHWMNIKNKEKGEFPYVNVVYMPQPCMHCDDAPCMQHIDNKEIYRRPDGIVIIDPEKSRDKKEIINACPHGAIWWNENTQSPQKCTFCAHLLDNEWEKPRCVQACPTGALTFHRIEDASFDAFISENNLKSYPPSKTGGIRKNGVLYKNLHLFTHCFIAGSVAMEKEGIKDCVKGAVVELCHENRQIARTTTDAFGDYKFNRLPADSGTYLIKINAEHLESGEIEVTVGTESCYAGTTWLKQQNAVPAN